MNKIIILCAIFALTACSGGKKDNADSVSTRTLQDGEFMAICDGNTMYVNRQSGDAVIINDKGQVVGEHKLEVQTEDGATFFKCGSKLYLAN